MLEPYDQIMADRGFEIKTILALHQCTLAIPPSGAKGVQFTSVQSKETSTVANVRIYVEQAIKNLPNSKNRIAVVVSTYCRRHYKSMLRIT